MVAILGRRLNRRAVAEAVFVVVAAAPVVAALALPILVLDDGGLHLASASALGYLWTGQFGDVLTARPGLPPNLTAELVLLGLLQIASPMWALKLLTAAVLIGFALAARRLVVAAGAPGYWGTVLLPFAWNRPLALGFLGFAAAVALALVAIAMALERPARPRMVLLAALLVLTWLTHLVPALVATAVCATLIVVGRAGPGEPGPDAGLARRALSAAVLSAPVVLLTVASVVLNPPDRSVPQPGSVIRRIISVLALIKANVSDAPAEYVAYGLAALILYIAAGLVLITRLRTSRALRPLDTLLVAAVVADVAAVVVPEGVNGAGGFLGVRLAVFAPLLLGAWLAGHLARAEWRWSGAVGTTVVAAMAAIALLLVAVRLPEQLRYSRLAAESLELEPCLPVGSTIIQIDLDDVGALAEQADPLSHQVGLLATDRRSLDVGNESGWVPYYLWRFRDGQNADAVLATGPYGTTSYPPRVDLAGALERGERLDAVLLVGRRDAEPAVLDDAPTATMLADLTAAYRLVRTSSGGESALWLRAGVQSGCL